MWRVKLLLVLGGCRCDRDECSDKYWVMRLWFGSVWTFGVNVGLEVGSYP